MKAAVLYEINKPLVVDEIDIDDVGPGQVMVKTIASGLCRSDLHRMEGRTPTEVPAVIGHEAAGYGRMVECAADRDKGYMAQ